MKSYPYSLSFIRYSLFFVLCSLFFSQSIGAQNIVSLWATGTAVPEGTRQLTLRPDGIFCLKGALNDGELKLQTTETFVEGETQFLKPQYVDSYLVNFGLPYTLTKDETAEGWVVSFQEDLYLVQIDVNERTVRGDLFLPWNELLMAGSAHPGGADRREWSRDNMSSFVRSQTDPYEFTWTGELNYYPDVVEPGRFKLEGQSTWGPRELHPWSQDEPVLESTKVRIGGPDTKWSVSQNGTYRITVNLWTETFHAELLSASRPDNATAITAPQSGAPSGASPLRGEVVYSLDGHRQTSLRPGLNIVRRPDGTVVKMLKR